MIECIKAIHDHKESKAPVSQNEDPFSMSSSTTDDLTTVEQSSDPETKAEEGAKTKRSGRTPRSSSMALNGRPVDVEEYSQVELPDWIESGRRYSELMEYVPEDDLDISDVHSVNREILSARRRLFRVQRALADANRKASEAKFAYRRKRARILVGISGGTEKTREATADVACEEEFGHLIVSEQLADELLNQSRAVKAELDSLANLSHNIRAQMSLQ